MTSPFTIFHVLISLVGIISGFLVMAGMIRDRPLGRANGLFLITTIATTVTGFMFPINGFTPAMGVGIVSMACFVCITRALARTPASLLAPFQYASIVWAAVLGYAVWGDVPGPNVVVGSVVIVGSGLAVVVRERGRTRAVAAAL